MAFCVPFGRVVVVGELQLGIRRSFGKEGAIFSLKYLWRHLMKLEWRIKQIMDQNNIKRYGLETEIADACGLHRHTVGKLLRNQAQSSKLEVLEKICEWLIEQGVPADILPGALLGVRPSGLWQAIGQSKKILIYLGEYHIKSTDTSIPPVSPPVSISRHDLVVATEIVDFLSSEKELLDTKPAVKTLYVPFSFTPGVLEAVEDGFKRDKKRAGRIFHNMRKQKQNDRSIIMIGSPRVNYLVEYLVADLFNCEPFVSSNKEFKVPFYTTYRDFDRPVPSCFGGQAKPPGVSKINGHGTFYLDENFKWQFLQWQRKESDAGIVIIIREAETVEMAVFGFSGRATKAIGDVLRRNPEKFWPGPDSNSNNTFKAGNKEIGVYICQVKFSKDKIKRNDLAYEDFENDEVEIKSMNRKVLEKFLSKGQSKTTQE